jgi:hypothetical protein
VFSGGASVLLSCRVTMKLGRATLSPTVVDTITDRPAVESCEAASLYFCHMTLGCEEA